LRLVFSVFNFSFSALRSGPHPTKAVMKKTIKDNDTIAEMVRLISLSPPFEKVFREIISASLQKIK
jgi:hypothetical protein